MAAMSKIAAAILLLLTPHVAEANIHAAQLQQVSLPASFTLVYEMTDRDISSSEQRDAAADSVRKGYEWMVAHGSMTQQQAEWSITHILPNIRAPRPAVTYIVTLSARDGKLFCRRQNRNKSNNKAGVLNEMLIYDGKQSFIMQNRRMEVTPGFAITSVAPCPIPAASIPFVPLIKNPVAVGASTGLETFTGDVPCLDGNATSGISPPDILFEPGEVRLTTAGGRAKILEIKTIKGGKVSTRWQYTNSRLFNSHWIATDMTWTSYQDGLPYKACVFHLQSMSMNPLPVKQFDGSHWTTPVAGLIVHQGWKAIVIDNNLQLGDI